MARIASGRASSTREHGPGASEASRRAPRALRREARDTASARSVSRKPLTGIDGLTAPPYGPHRVRADRAPNPRERAQMNAAAGPRGLLVLAVLTLAIPLGASGATWPRVGVTPAITLSTTTVVLPTTTLTLPRTTTSVTLPATTLTLPLTTTSVTLPVTTLTLPLSTTTTRSPTTTTASTATTTRPPTTTSTTGPPATAPLFELALTLRPARTPSSVPERMGAALAASGGTFVIGAPGDSSAAPDAGIVYVVSASSPPFGRLLRVL